MSVFRDPVYNRRQEIGRGISGGYVPGFGSMKPTPAEDTSGPRAIARADVAGQQQRIMDAQAVLDRDLRRRRRASRIEDLLGTGGQLGSGAFLGVK